jgi:hypothetical protein
VTKINMGKRKWDSLNATKYKKYCQYMKIPYPDNQSEHSISHINGCITCKTMWELLIFEEMFENKLSLSDTSTLWNSYDETTRETRLKFLTKRKDNWLKNLHKRNLSSYQMFLKAHMHKECGTSHAEMMQQNSTVWKNMTCEQKQLYSDQSSVLKHEKTKYIAGLPEYRLSMWKNYKKSLLCTKPKNEKKKKNNTFITYLIQKWSLEKQQPSCKRMKYREVMKICSSNWSTFSKDEKKLYNVI